MPQNVLESNMKRDDLYQAVDQVACNSLLDIQAVSELLGF